MSPCIPKAWPKFEITYRYGTSRYDIVVENPYGVCTGIATLELNGQPLSVSQARVLLEHDGWVGKLTDDALVCCYIASV